MPTSDSTTHAINARESLRHLAHTTRHLTDPGEVYELLGDLSGAITSLAQSLHQIGKVHDNLEVGQAHVAGGARTGRATSYAVSWELHRAAQILTQAAAGIDRAHENEARISYTSPDPLLTPRQSSGAPTNNGLRR
ncbi:hypothetical protein ACFWQC_03020 [Nocardioides sp. NPDC058538]|uniref:hypothetical protein n=1 Tax=Nocardioides sp. NPDC058538 TaxID=3346542 RepID=UPI00365B0FEB